MDFGLTDKTLVLHFLSLTETALTAKQAREAANIIKDLVKKEFLEQLESAPDKLNFLNSELYNFFWTHNDHRSANWFYDFNRINDDLVLKHWDAVKEKLGIQSVQIITIEKKEYRTYLDYLALKKKIFKLIEEKRELYRWEWRGTLREITPFKKALTKKDDSLNYNSEFLKKLEFKKTSNKTLIVIKRNNKQLEQFIKDVLKAKKESVIYFKKKQENKREKQEIELELNYGRLMSIRLQEMRF